MEYENKSPLERLFRRQFERHEPTPAEAAPAVEPAAPVVEVEEAASDATPVVEIATFNLTSEQRARVIEGLRRVLARVMSRVAGEDEVVVLLPEEDEEN